MPSPTPDTPPPFRLPDETNRWRCGHCGNLTRFDVTRSSAVAEYWHFNMAGEPTVDETTVLRESVDKVTCRWCGAGDRIELVPRPAQADATDGDDGPAEPGLGGTP